MIWSDALTPTLSRRERENRLRKVLVFDTGIKNGFGDWGGVVAAGAAVFEHAGEGNVGILARSIADEPGVVGMGIDTVATIPGELRVGLLASVHWWKLA